MKKVRFAIALGVVGFAAMVGASSSYAGLRSFYWTSDSQSYSYNRYEAQNECYARAEAAAYPYAYNTCVQKIGYEACQNSTSQTQYLAFGGGPGLFSCTVRVWVQAWELVPSYPTNPYYPPVPPAPRY